MARQANRREFFANVGRGMLVASVGYSAAFDLGLTPAFADDAPTGITFGAREPLVALLQETSADRLLPVLVEKLRSGTELRELVAAAALANARTFAGEDYIGFHTLMALSPAYQMSLDLPDERRAQPIFKVLYRNSHRIGEVGGRSAEALKPVTITDSANGVKNGDDLRGVVRAKDAALAEQALARFAQQSPDEAFNNLLHVVHDNTDVHRVVLPYRAWDLLDLVGQEHAQTMLRQSLRYCLKSEQRTHRAEEDKPRTVLPAILEKFGLLSRSAGTREVDDNWVETMSNTIFSGSPEHAAEAVAAALAEGISPIAVGEAVTLAANQLILRDAGRPADQTSDGKPVGSVHGDSIGVHACDSANAWRNMSLVSNHRNQMASLVLGAYQVAKDRLDRGGDFLNWQPWTAGDALAEVDTVAAGELLPELDAAIRGNNQRRAASLVLRCDKENQSARGVFDVMLKYAISEDGALHAEKFYRTAADEFARARPAFRWRQLVALSRVTASEFGRPAPGYAEACELLRV